MEIKTLASGSTGNCYLIDGKPRLLIEAGIPIRRIKEGLDFQLSSVAGVLVTHVHADHSKAAKDIMKAGIPCYMGKATAEALGLSGHRLHVVEAMRPFSVGPWRVLPFPVVHDVPALGFLIAGEGERIVYISDSAYSPYRFKGVTRFMIEVNYDKQTLRENLARGVIDSLLYKRLLRTHMGLETAVEMLRANDLSRVEEVRVIHCSQGNANVNRIKRVLQEKFGKPVYIEGGE